jgi:CRISPR/Cas system CSM-associated protein Csm4 (group 5 of RAMP superfamily)
MIRLGWLDEWLAATARAGESEVRFSSCFPFQGDLGYVIPPRTLWPPQSAGQSGRVRWKSARFVPLGVVQALLSGQVLDEDHWTVDGTSECLVPTGQPGPFRTGIRWNAAVDRLSGASERHSSACIEFREGAGLWTIVSFASDQACERWCERVKSAFRVLADTGFGGERSRGWGRSAAPEFIDGVLPDMILPPAERPQPVAPAEELAGALAVADVPVGEPITVEPVVEAATEPACADPVIEAEVLAPETVEPLAAAPDSPEPEPGPEPEPLPPIEEPPAPEPEPPAQEPPPPESEPPVQEPPLPEPQGSATPHWLLGLYTPSAADTVDWSLGNYSLMTRGGRVDSPAASGDLKKHLNMVTEGSVIYATSALRGGAPDVAPDGFPHPVFRAGFAVAIPIGGGAS